MQVFLSLLILGFDSVLVEFTLRALATLAIIKGKNTNIKKVVINNSYPKKKKSNYKQVRAG